MRIRAVSLLALVAPFAAEAAAPPLVPVTGYLTDDAGAPIDGTTTLHLKLYAGATGSSTLWDETQDVDVVDGQFTVYLGDQTALGLDLFRDNATVFLGMAVGTGAEMAPRFEVATSPFAAYAQYCEDAAMLGGVDSSEYRLVTDPVQWSDLQAVPAGISDGDADTTYTAGTGLTLTGTTFDVVQSTVDGWARAVAYDSITELRADLDGIYAAKMTCTPNQVLMANGSGAWLCTDSTALPLSESIIDGFVGNNGYASDTALTALTARVGTAEGSITTLQTGLGTTNTNLATETSARTAADTTLTTNLAAEVTARTSAVAAEISARTTAVAAEAAARTTADSTLTTNLAAEVTARTAAVSAEVTARTAADTAISNGLSTAGTFNASTNPVDWTKLKNAPAGIIRNLGTAKQTADITTAAQAWSDIPGATVTVTVPTGGLTLRLAANGGVHAITGSPNYTHCGLRFVVDGTPYGEVSWGDVIVGVSNSSSGSAWHEPWSMTRDLPAAAGSHTIKLQLSGWGGSSSACHINTQDYMASRLIVEGY